MQFLNALKGIQWNAQTVGALSAGTSVLLGAFGAHGLKSHLSPLPKSDQDYYMDIWKTAAQYQMYHSIGMIIAPMVQKQAPNFHPGAFPRSAKLFMTGMTFFSGSLYALVLSKQRWLGAITPIGGVAFAAGWAFLAARQ